MAGKAAGMVCAESSARRESTGRFDRARTGREGEGAGLGSVRAAGPGGKCSRMWAQGCFSHNSRVSIQCTSPRSWLNKDSLPHHATSPQMSSCVVIRGSFRPIAAPC